MPQPFEGLPTTPTAEEVIDQAFSRAARAGRAKTGVEAQQSMLQTAGNVASDNLQHVVRTWPDVAALHPFYRELADAVLQGELDDEGGVDDLRQHLASVSTAASTIEDVQSEYQGRLAGDADVAKSLREQAFARIADVVEGVEDDLAAISTARDALRDLPDVKPEEPAIVVAGSPNVGKSSFVNAVTAAHNETATYPFTTTTVHLGHVERDHITYQLVDTPGLLDRPPAERNAVEAQAASALTHLADAVLVLLDPSEEAGYPLAEQEALRDHVAETFDVPVLTVANKADRSRDAEADHYMSVTEDEGVEDVLDAAVDAVDYEPELPYDG